MAKRKSSLFLLNFIRLFLVLLSITKSEADGQISSYEVPSSASSESTTYLPLDRYETSTEASTQTPLGSSDEAVRILVGDPVSIENYITSAETLRKRTIWKESSSEDKIEHRAGDDQVAQASHMEGLYIPPHESQSAYQIQGADTSEYTSVVPLESEQYAPAYQQHYQQVPMAQSPRNPVMIPVAVPQSQYPPRGAPSNSRQIAQYSSQSMAGTQAGHYPQQQQQSVSFPPHQRSAPMPPQKQGPPYPPQHIAVTTQPGTAFPPTQNAIPSQQPVSPFPSTSNQVASLQGGVPTPNSIPATNPERTLETGEMQSSSIYMPSAAMPFMSPTGPTADERTFKHFRKQKRRPPPVHTPVYTHAHIIPHYQPVHHPHHLHHHDHDHDHHDSHERRGRRRRRGPRRRKPRGGYRKRRRGKRPPRIHAHETAQMPAYAPAFVSYGPVFGPPPNIPVAPTHMAPAHVAPPTMAYGPPPTVSYIPIVHHGPGAPPAPTGHHIIPVAHSYGQTYQAVQPSHTMPPSYSNNANVYSAPPASYNPNSQPPRYQQSQPSTYGGSQQPPGGYGGPQQPPSGYGGPQQPPSGYGGPQQPHSGYGGPQPPAYSNPTLTISVEAPSNQYHSGPVSPPAPMRGPPRGYPSPQGPPRGPPYPPSGPPPQPGNNAYNSPSHPPMNYNGYHHVASAPPTTHARAPAPPVYQPVNYAPSQPYTSPVGYGPPMNNFGPPFSNVGQLSPFSDKDPWARPMGFSSQASNPQSTKNYDNDPHYNEPSNNNNNNWYDNYNNDYQGNGIDQGNRYDDPPPRKYRRRRPNYNKNNDNSNCCDEPTGPAPSKNTYWAGEDADAEFDDYKYRKKDWGKFHQRAVNYFTIDNRNKGDNGSNEPSTSTANDNDKFKFQIQLSGSNLQNIETKPDSSSSSSSSSSSASAPSSSSSSSGAYPRKRLRQRQKQGRNARPAANFNTNYNSPGMSKDPKKTDWSQYDNSNSAKAQTSYSSALKSYNPKPTQYSTLPASTEGYKADPTHSNYPKLTYDSLTRRILPKNNAPTFIADEVKSRMFESGMEFKKMLNDHDRMRI